MRPESLARLQREFLSLALPRASDAPGASAGGLIRPAGSLTAEEAIAVYREGCVARLSEALGDTYEATWRVLGDEAFLRLAREYVESHPSPYFNLQHYGDEFPEFLATTAEAGELPFLRDLAAFERELLLLFHRARSVPAAAGEIAQRLGEAFAAGADARLVLAPELLLFESRHPVREIWNQRASPRDPSLAIDWRRRARLWMHKDADGGVEIHDATESEWELLVAFQAGRSLAGALSGDAAAKMTEEEVSRFFADLMRSGIILDILTD